VTELVVAPGDSTPRTVMRALAHHHCNRLIETTHSVSTDLKGRFFQIQIDAMHVRPAEDTPRVLRGTNVTTVGDYSRKYRYPMTPASLDAFHTGTFGDAAYADLKKSGVLEPLR
jgi:hypothetical protein